MKIELIDLFNDKRSYGQAYYPRGNYKLIDFFNKKDLQDIPKYVKNVQVNDKLIPNWEYYIPSNNDDIKFYLMPKDFGLSAIIAAISVAVAVISVISFIIQLVSTPDPPSGGRIDESATYGFDGINTNFPPGKPIQVNYGSTRIGGQMLSMAVDVSSSGKRQELSLLLGLGRGEITAVNCVEINGIPVANFDVVSLETRLGLSSQSIIPGYENIRNTFSDNREFSDGQITYTTNGLNVDRVDVQVAALQGVIRRGPGGKRKDQNIVYSIEYKRTAVSCWTVASTKNFAGKTSAELWDTTLIDFGSSSQWDLRLTWLTATNTNADRDSWRLWLKNVTEIEETSLPYSGLALLSVKALATAELQGGRPNITCIVDGLKIRVHSTAASFQDGVFNNNPAWVIRDYMTNTTYGMGNWITDADIHIQSFVDFAELCNSMVPDGSGNLEAQFQLDVSLDAKRSQWQQVNDFLKFYRSSLIYSNGQFKVVSERDDNPVRQIFHSNNIEDFSVTYAKDIPLVNQADLTFANQILDYERDVLYVQDSESIFGDGDPIVPFEMELFGITRESEAQRLGSYFIKRKRSLYRDVRFTTGLEALAVEPGDRAIVGIPITDFTLGYGGRVTDGTSTGLILDREITFVHTEVYDLYVWHIDADTVESTIISSQTGPKITITPDSGFNFKIQPGDRYQIGVQSENLIDLTVAKVERNPSDGRHVISGREFLSLVPDTPLSPSSGFTIDLNDPPPQPLSVVGRSEVYEYVDGTILDKIFIDVVPSPQKTAGIFTVAGSTNSVVLASSENPNDDALKNERIRIISGNASGDIIFINSYDGTNKRAFGTFGTTVATSDRYEILKHGGSFAGFDVFFHSFDQTALADQNISFLGTEAELDFTTPDTGTFTIIPFSNRNVRNRVGPWVINIETHGDSGVPPDPGSIYAIAGTGKDINVYVVPTSVGDFYIHEFFRHTTSDFTVSSLIGEAHQIYHDTDVTFDTEYFYWARAKDRSFNVSSVVGPANITIEGILNRTDQFSGQAVMLDSEDTWQLIQVNSITLAESDKVTAFGISYFNQNKSTNNNTHNYLGITNQSSGPDVVTPITIVTSVENRDKTSVPMVVRKTHVNDQGSGSIVYYLWAKATGTGWNGIECVSSLLEADKAG